ncbi:NAD(P)H-dependent oxidoreductase [Uliginosibacterium sp. H1]|uniref:NAD(P)H-dependent oxidoreductase n=1 Tax=Uliginosibacterium sp. H1 TaxID=3114757 RepID=UPI002E174587|nr:NAD(P)H-dependent oxidoreductase [Uliginosibacterium sp. H1]
MGIAAEIKDSSARATRVALIYGSTREGRFCDKVMAWLRQQLVDQVDLQLDLIDPAGLVQASGKVAEHKALAAMSRRLAAAQGFIVVVPEYNHGYPAPLKAFIDSFGTEWQGKPVGFVSYGGASGGLRAVEQLRQVFIELHAVNLQASVSFANAAEQFDIDGTPWSSERAGRALGALLAQLRWWAQALQQAGAQRPYPGRRATRQIVVPPAPAPAVEAQPVVLVNHFKPKPGKLDEFVALQDAAATLAREIPGWRGSRLLRDEESGSAVLISSFDDADAHREWMATSVAFAQHRDKVRALIDSSEPRFFEQVYERTPTLP